MIRPIVSLIALLIIGCGQQVKAACTGSSPNWVASSVADITDCHTLASNGDTINVAAGTYNIGATITISKAIHLKGAGVGQTIFIDDELSSQMLLVNMVSGLNFEMSHIEFRDGLRSTENTSGIIFLNNNSTTAHAGRVIIHHNKFDHMNGLALRLNRVYGVVHHNDILATSPHIPVYATVVTDNVWPDDRWNEAASFGAESFLFFEDNTCTFDTGSTFFCIDAAGGSRMVIRHNTFLRASLSAHGTESAGRPAGTRAMEIYSNTFNNTSGGVGFSAILDQRSGVALVYNNTVTNFPSITGASVLLAIRTVNDFSPWGIADGRNPWDNNDPSNPYVSGTASSGGTRTMTDTGAAWTTNQWTGYILRKTSSLCNVPISAVNTTSDTFTVVGHGFSVGNSVYIQGHSGSTPHVMGFYTVATVSGNDVTLTGVNVTVAGTGGYMSLGGSAPSTCSAPVVSNTATQITFEPSSFSPDMTFSGGEGYEINRIFQVFDQPGLGSRGFDLNGVTLPVPPTWSQVAEANYEWNNLLDGVTDLDFNVPVVNSLLFTNGTHYVNDTQMPGYTAYQYPHPLNVPDVVVTNVGEMDL